MFSRWVPSLLLFACIVVIGIRGKRQRKRRDQEMGADFRAEARRGRVVTVAVASRSAALSQPEGLSHQWCCTLSLTAAAPNALFPLVSFSPYGSRKEHQVNECIKGSRCSIYFLLKQGPWYGKWRAFLFSLLTCLLCPSPSPGWCSSCFFLSPLNRRS